MEKENRYLEYKEIVNRTYLKTVSAFANYNDGKIIFGINDDYKIIGIENPEAACLNIGNQINDSIRPKPDYSLKINEDKTITLSVKKGISTPYRYNGKCYRRSDSSTLEVDFVEENRLVLEGLNKSYEELPCNKTDLTFEILSKAIVEKLNLKSFTKDTMKTLNLYNDREGYNNAAFLLADVNECPGLDIAVFGDNYNIFRKRIQLNKISVLKQYEEALEIYKSEYLVEEIKDGYRKEVELVPLEAYREAVANAIIHRVWDVNANTKIEMHKDKIIISSPGGLLPEISKEDYLKGNYSYLRNPILANVFHRLDIVEIFATGIRRINAAYKDKQRKPEFDLTDNSISVTLPTEINIILSKNEKNLFSKMETNIYYSRLELEEKTGLNKATIIRAINSLIDKGLITKEGKAKGTRYIKT